MSSKKFYLSLIFLFIIFSSVFSVTLAHNGAVNQFFPISVTEFFSCSSDGSVVFFNNSETEYYQLSELPIKQIVVYPSKSLVAIYETDDFSINRVSVWDWKAKKRLYAKRFLDSVLNISFSAKGKFLMVSTHSIGSISFFDAKTGEQQQLLHDTSSLVALAATGATEKTVVTYSQLGTIEYGNLQTGEQKKRLPTEKNLYNVVLHKNNTLLTGFSDGTAYTIDMTTGKAVNAARMYSENSNYSSFICVEKKDSDPMFFIQDSQKVVVKNYSSEIGSFVKPFKQKITAIEKISSTDFLLGTDDGALYKISYNPENEKSKQFIITIIAENRKSSVSSVSTTIIDNIPYCYFIASGSIFRTTDPLSEPELMFSNIKADSIFCTKDEIIAWSDKDVFPIYYLKENEVTELYSPRGKINDLYVSNGKMVCIESNSKVVVIDITTRKVIFSYVGAGLQSAVINEQGDLLYVAKAASSHPLSPLLKISIATGEIVPIQIDSSMLFSLSLEKTGIYLYSLSLNTQNFETETNLVRVDLANGNVKILAKYPDENANSFLKIYDDVVYTNLGRTILLAYSLNKNSKIEVKRNESLAKSVSSSGDFIQVLQQNGTIAWYSSKTLSLVSLFEKQNGTWIIKRIE